MQIGGNEPAFPTPPVLDGGKVLYHSAQPGMSLLDWFAGMALQGILASERTGSRAWEHEDRAEHAWRAAHTMLVMRPKESK